MDEELSAEERELLAADDRREARFGYGAGAVVALVLAAGAIFLTQVVMSIRYGTWPQLTLADGLALVGVEAGPAPQKLIAWILAWPVWVVLLALAVAGVLVVTRHDRQPVPDALRAARMKRARQPEPPNP